MPRLSHCTTAESFGGGRRSRSGSRSASSSAKVSCCGVRWKTIDATPELVDCEHPAPATGLPDEDGEGSGEPIETGGALVGVRGRDLDCRLTCAARSSAADSRRPACHDAENALGLPRRDLVARTPRKSAVRLDDVLSRSTATNGPLEPLGIRLVPPSEAADESVHGKAGATRRRRSIPVAVLSWRTSARLSSY